MSALEAQMSVCFIRVKGHIFSVRIMAGETLRSTRKIDETGIAKTLQNQPEDGIISAKHELYHRAYRNRHGFGHAGFCGTGAGFVQG